MHGAAWYAASRTSSPCATPDSSGSVAGSGGRAGLALMGGVVLHGWQRPPPPGLVPTPSATPDSPGSVAGTWGRAVAPLRRLRRVRPGADVTAPPCAATRPRSSSVAPATSSSRSMSSTISMEPRTASSRGSAPRTRCRGARGGVSAAGAVPAPSITAWTGGSLYRREHSNSLPLGMGRVTQCQGGVLGPGRTMEGQCRDQLLDPIGNGNEPREGGN